MQKPENLANWPEGNEPCEIDDCPNPYGRAGTGFSPVGMKQHVIRVHKDTDPGTPGHEVIMGEATSFLEDVRSLLDPEGIVPPVESSPEERARGVWVTARNGQLYVDNVAANLENFITGIRLAVRIS